MPIQDGSHFCPAHGERYGALEQCPRCIDDPAPRPDVGADDEIALPPPPAGCASGIEHERKFTELADLGEAWARKAATGKKANPSTAAKLLAEAVKARRAAAASAKEREDRAFAVELKRRVSELRGARH